MKLVDGIELNNFYRVVLDGEHVWDRHKSGDTYVWYNANLKCMSHDKMCRMIQYYWYNKGYRLVVNSGCINLYMPDKRILKLALIARGTSYVRKSHRLVRKVLRAISGGTRERRG